MRVAAGPDDSYPKYASPVIRSALFVPAHREGWVEKAIAAGPDAVILDLEDSVPDAEKSSARGLVGDAVGLLAAGGVTATVRINGPEDLEACVVKGIAALVLPKVDDPEQVRAVDAKVSALEGSRNLSAGGIGLIVTLETAGGYLAAADLARAPRVVGLLAATGKGGDAQRELGYRPTEEGLETLYVRSHAILAARAARLPHVLTGPWQDFHDLNGLRRQAAFNRNLGFNGEALIHPSNVEIVNEAYAPTDEEIDYHRGLIAAYEAAEAGGAGAVDYRGDHVDAAHYRTSLEFVERAGAR
jgi:citrate lyase subunit beta / citryl-CoA lyase